jgi:hypothetical protein
LGVLFVALALAFLLFGMMTLIASRIQSGSRHEAQMLNAEELRTLRERAEAQRQAGAPSGTGGPSPEEPPR